MNYLDFLLSKSRGMERVMGIEPTLFAWEARVLPLNDTRVALNYRAVKASQSLCIVVAHETLDFLALSMLVCHFSYQRRSGMGGSPDGH